MYKVFTSKKEKIINSIELKISPEYSRCFAGIRYFNTKGDQITPTKGQITVKAKHLTNNSYSDMHNPVLEATNPGSESEWGGNATFVKATPSNLIGTDLDTYQLVVVQNLS